MDRGRALGTRPEGATVKALEKPKCMAGSEPLDLLLARLQGVRRTVNGWIALCPAHADRSASLSIAATDDGCVLLNDFAGCGAADVVAAVGLSLSDLFPDRMRDDSPNGRRAARAAFRQSAWSAALGVLAREATVVLCVTSLMPRNALAAEDAERLALAIERIDHARQVLQ